MANLSQYTLEHSANMSLLNQGFVIELDSNLLLQIMSSYELKASDVRGNYSFNQQLYDKLIKTPLFTQGGITLDNASKNIIHWPQNLSWLQLNHQINSFLLAWLSDYKLGAKLDAAFLLVRSLDLESTKKSYFHYLLIHLLARVTNQFDLYKASYLQHFNLESGLPNQELLMQLLRQRLNVMDGMTSANQVNLGLILINLNINFDEKTQLISASSHLMLAATQIIQQHLSDDCTLFNTSATELAIMIEPLSSPTQLSLIVSTLMHAFESKLPVENITLIIKPYFSGISTFNVQTNAISIYEHAKLALHHAIIKNERIKIYDKYISSSSINNHLLDEAIIEAFQQNELAVYLQPIVSIADEVCNNAEILLR